MFHYRKQFLYLLLWVGTFCTATSFHAAPGLAEADLILKNGRVWTGDPENPWAEAIAIRHSKIVAVGDNGPVANWALADAQVVDLHGRLAIPGFNDAYTHFLASSLSQFPLDLSSKPVPVKGRQGGLGPPLPEPSREKKLFALEQGIKLAASMGITSIQDAAGDAELVSLFEELDRQKKLNLRVNVSLPVLPAAADDGINKILEFKQNSHAAHLRLGAVRLAPEGWSPDAWNSVVALCDSGGLQIWVRAATERSVRMALDAYDQARKENGPYDGRLRLEHLDSLAPPDVSRMARMGVVAAMQPAPVQLALASKLEQAGVRVIFGGLDPIQGIANAVNRPDQHLSVEAALRAYTANGAYASFSERMKGKLKSGMFGDITVLSQDIFTIASSEIAKTKVDLTFFDGQIVYTRSPEPRR